MWRRSCRALCGAAAGGSANNGSRTIGQGPRSAAARARVAREAAGASGAAPNMMQHITDSANVGLRLSLAGLVFPDELRARAERGEVVYRSPEWRRAMVRLYRCILRLHNKTVTVSLDRSRSGADGPAAAVRAAAGLGSPSVPSSSSSGGGGSGEGPGEERFFQRHLLTEQQREFGNAFVANDFRRHADADALAALTFYAGWFDYVMQLASGVTARELTEEERRLLSGEQKAQLEQLRESLVASRAANSPAAPFP